MPTTPAYLTPQTAVIPFRGGVDRKSDEKSVEPLKLLELENASFFEPGQIQHDNGYDRLLDAVSISSPMHRVVAPASVFAGKNLQYRLDARDILASVGNGLIGAPSVRSLVSVADGQAAFKSADYAVVGGYELVCACEAANSGTIIAYERATGSRVSILTLAGTTTPARLVVVGAYVFAVWIDAGNLQCLRFDSGNGTFGATTTLIGDVGAAKYFDVVGGASSFYVAYNQGANVKVVKCSTAPAVTANATVAGTPDDCIGIGIRASDEALLVAWGDNANGVRMAGFTSTPAAVSNAAIDAAITDAVRITVGENPTDATVFIERATRVTHINVLFTGAATSSSARELFSCSLAHKPSQQDGVLLVGLMRDMPSGSELENWYCTAATDTGGATIGLLEPIAWYLYQTAHANAAQGHVPFAQFDAGSLVFAVQERVLSLATSLSSFLVKTGVAKFTPYDAQHVAVGPARVFAGGFLEFDGVEAASLPFAPQITAAVSANVGGALVAGEVYEYVAVAELTTRSGLVIESPPSAPVSVEIGGGHNGVQLTVTRPWARAGNSTGTALRTRIYRTRGNVGAPHYALSVTDTGTLVSTATFSANDLEADAAIQTRRILYTDGNILPRFQMPGGRVLVVHQDRLWTIDEHTGELCFSTELVDGELPGWHPNLRLGARTDGLEPKALVSSATGLWVFGRDTSSAGKGAIGLVLGEGPNDAGEGSSYQLQRLDGADVGTENWRTTLSIPGGILFEDTRQGIHMLPSGGGAPVPIGEPVEDKRTGQTLVAAVLLEDRKEVRFVASSGRQLVYHYDLGQWSVRQVQGLGATTVVDTCVWAGKHVIATSGPRVWRHADSTWRDGDTPTFAPLKITTAWIRLADFSGLKRVWEIYLLGKHYDPHLLTVQIAYDYNDADIQEHAFVEADIASVASSGKYELRVPLRKQQCESLKVTVIDAAAVATTNGRGFGLNAIRMHYGVIGRGSRKPAYAVKG